MRAQAWAIENMIATLHEKWALQGDQQVLHFFSLWKSQFTNPIAREYYKLHERFELVRMKEQVREMEALLDPPHASKFNSTSSASNSVSTDLGASIQPFVPSFNEEGVAFGCHVFWWFGWADFENHGSSTTPLSVPFNVGDDEGCESQISHVSVPCNADHALSNDYRLVPTDVQRYVQRLIPSRYALFIVLPPIMQEEVPQPTSHL